MTTIWPGDSIEGTWGTVDLPPEGKYRLVGREAEMVRLEHALQEAPIVVLTGAAGVGKTELACGFGRRLLDGRPPDRDAADPNLSPDPVDGEGTGRVPKGAILFTSYEYGAGLCRVLHEMGTTLRGIHFARLSLEQQRQWALDYLNRGPSLLIWDGFDQVFHYLDNDEIGELLDFLRDLGDGPTRVIITTSEEGWLDRCEADHVRMELHGLSDADTRCLAELILDGAVEDRSDWEPDYSSLLGGLEGNSMSMRVVLPHLKGNTPGRVLSALAQANPEGASKDEAGETALRCSFSLLSPRTTARLPVLSLFRQRVLLDVLTFITQGEVYKSIMGEEMGWGSCRTLLREARDCGILDSISPSVYVIPARVSRYLAQELPSRLTASRVGPLEEEFVRVYADLGDYFMENLTSESAESTVTGVLAEEANLLRALDLAEQGGQWERTQLVLQPLGQVYKMQERLPELRRLRQRLLSRIGHRAEEAVQKGAVELWLYIQGSEVNDAIGRLELDGAEGICQELLSYLESTGERRDPALIASVYHQMGQIAQGKAQYPQAEELYHKSLEITKSLGSEAEAADNYHRLGSISQARGNYEEAEARYRTALEIRERLEDQAEAANESYHLGSVAEARGAFDAAFQWYDRARQGYEQSGDQASGASVYHRLGLLCQGRYDYEEATGWYQRALLVYEEINDEAAGASDCYELGMIALRLYEYGQAEDWFRQARDAYDNLADEGGVANSYHQLGVAAHGQRQHADAEGWYQKALEVLLRLDDEVTAAITWGQLGLLADQRGNYAHAVWYVAHTFEIAKVHDLPLVSQAKTHLSSLRLRMGTAAFLKSWEEVSDSDVLRELE